MYVAVIWISYNDHLNSDIKWITYVGMFCLDWYVSYRKTIHYDMTVIWRCWAKQSKQPLRNNYYSLISPMVTIVSRLQIYKTISRHTDTHTHIKHCLTSNTGKLDNICCKHFICALMEVILHSCLWQPVCLKNILHFIWPTYSISSLLIKVDFKPSLCISGNYHH